MSGMSTGSTTYTRSDVRYIFNQFAADFHMIAEATGLWARGAVDLTVADIQAYAAEGYVTRITLEIKDASGTVVGVVPYDVRPNVVAEGQRPGGNRWPYMPTGRLKVQIIMSDKWYGLTDAQRNAFEANLNGRWPVGPSVSTSGLMLLEERTYAKNGFGLHKQTWVRQDRGT